MKDDVIEIIETILLNRTSIKDEHSPQVLDMSVEDIADEIAAAFLELAQKRYEEARAIQGDVSTPAKMMELVDEMLQVASGIEVERG